MGDIEGGPVAARSLKTDALGRWTAAARRGDKGEKPES